MPLRRLILSLALVLPFFGRDAGAQLSFGGTIADITIQGNQRYADEVLIDQMGVNIGDPFEATTLNAALKALVGSGLVIDVEFARLEDTLLVRVTEPLFVNRIFFQGNTTFKDERLFSFISTQPSDPLSDAKLQEDVRTILDAYASRGRYSAEVRPFVSDMGQGRADVIFEVVEGEVSRVSSVTFIGNEAFDDRTLRRIVSTKEYGRLRRLTQADRFTETAIARDVAALTAFYFDRGYADFEVTAAQGALAPDQSGFVVTFGVSEGKVYTFGQASIVSEIPGLSAGDLAGTPLVRTGRLYRPNQVEDAQDRLQARAEARGFGAAEVRVELIRQPETDVIDLVFSVVTGPAAQVERIDIEGNLRTRDYVIRREMRLAEGDAFSRNRLQRSRQRIRGLGYFANADVVTTPGSGPGQAIVIVEVEETSTGNLDFGGGVSSSGGTSLNLSYNERNFLGRGQRVRVSADLGEDTPTYRLSFNEPWMFGREVSGGFSLFDTSAGDEDSGYTLQETGLTLSSGYKLTERWRQSWSLTSKSSTVSDVTSTSPVIVDQEGETARMILGSKFAFNDLDSFFNPTAGVLFDISADLAGGPFGGDVNWRSIDYDLTYFRPLNHRLILKLSSSGGQIRSSDDDLVPLADRFGTRSDLVRGFAPGGIGPRDPETQDAIGATTYYAASAQLQFPMPGMAGFGVDGRLFYDLGTAFDEGRDYSLDYGSGPTLINDSDAWRSSIGYGLTWNSPLGPMQFDWGYAQAEQSFDELEEFSFSLGLGL